MYDLLFTYIFILIYYLLYLLFIILLFLIYSCFMGLKQDWLKTTMASSLWQRIREKFNFQLVELEN